MSNEAKLNEIVKRNMDIFLKIEALDAQLRRPLDSNARREIAPWTMLGREKLEAEELAVWRLLDAKEIAKQEAIDRIFTLMQAYYGSLS